MVYYIYSREYCMSTYRGSEDIMLAAATDEQKDSLKKYMKKTIKLALQMILTKVHHYIM